MTADNPPIDPDVRADVIALAHSSGAAYTSNNNPPGWPHGLDRECVPFGWLDRAHREAGAPFERRHVVPFVRQHNEVKPANLPCPAGGLSGFRRMLDAAADHAFLEALFEIPPNDPAGFSFCGPLATRRRHPELPSLNAAVPTLAHHRGGTGTPRGER